MGYFDGFLNRETPRRAVCAVCAGVVGVRSVAEAEAERVSVRSVIVVVDVV